jgi:hypothetical protein
MSEFYECPDIPEFLEKAEVEVMEGNFDAVPMLTSALLSTYRNAKNRDIRAAEEFAERFESGNLPCRASTHTALKWYHYAANLGSVSAALRMAKHKLWESGDNASESVRKFAALSISNALKDRHPTSTEYNLAAQAALILLDSKPTDEDVQLVRSLLDIKKMQTHPEYEEMNSRLHRLNCHTSSNDNAVKVASTRISEDGDFRAGPYKILEGKLPLVGLPDPDHIKETLDTEFPWFSDVTYYIFKQLITLEYSQRAAFKIRPLLLAGEPGVGKTTYVKRLAELVGTPFLPLMAAGQSDSMFIKGTSRGWSTARPGAIAQAIAMQFMVNPMVMVDEIDKVSPDTKNGRLWDVLLQLLEPATSKIFLDECLQVPCNFSHVNWIATANLLGDLPRPLIERFHVMLVPKPGPEYFETLLKNVVNGYANELNMDVRMLPNFDNNHYQILRRCKSPREINRVARDIIEDGFVEERKSKMRH